MLFNIFINDLDDGGAWRRGRFAETQHEEEALTHWRAVWMMSSIFLQERLREAGTLSLGQRRLRGIWSMYINTWWEGMRRRAPGSSQLQSVTGKQGWAQIKTWNSMSTQQNPFLWWSPSTGAGCLARLRALCLEFGAHSKPLKCLFPFSFF